jgi:hypothetical protein
MIDDRIEVFDVARLAALPDFDAARIDQFWGVSFSR